MKVGFEGIGERVVTFYNSATDGVVAGAPVKMTGNGEVGACAAGDRLCGVALEGEGEFVAVQVAGFVALPYSGTAPGVGFVKLLVDNKKGVKVDDGGAEFLVVDVDTVTKTVGFIL